MIFDVYRRRFSQRGLHTKEKYDGWGGWTAWWPRTAITAEGFTMAVFKDEELAAEILTGKKRTMMPVTVPPNPRRVWLLVLGASAFAAAAFALFSHRTHSNPPTDKPVTVADKPKTETAGPALLAARSAVPAPILPKAEIVSLPAVEATAPKAASTEPAPAPAKPATPAPNALPSAKVRGTSSELGVSVLLARSLLKSGKTTEALETLHSQTQSNANATNDDKADAAVIEGRALLAQGKVAEARLKFEPFSAATSSTESGADALLGNCWCKAGALARCPDSELEQFRGGPDSWAAAVSAMEQARRAEEKAAGKVETLEQARLLYQQAYESGKLDNAENALCAARLSDLASKLVLDPKAACVTPKAVFHKVETGDNVEKVARKYKVNTGQIKRINRLNDKLIVRLGQNLKLIPGSIVFKVDRTKLTGTLYIEGVFIRQYPVGIGPGNATPAGSYTVENKVLNPDWWYDGKKIPFGDPANILGTRWMGFAASDHGQGRGLGVHGTALPNSVPGRESKGCVRMHNADVEELYDFMPQGGKVEIAD